MLSGQYNPGQLEIVREILYSPTQDFDTAVFAGPLANYSFTVNGVAANVAQVIAATANDIITVTDNVVAGIKGDGIDSLRHIERLQFADQAIVIDGLNHGPVGLLTISDTTPTEDQLLTVSIAGVTDADNVSAANPTGAITKPVSYFWQAEFNPGSGIFTDLTHFAAGEVSRVEGTSFTPTEPFVGGVGVVSLVDLSLRVRAVYQDAHGVLEEVFSAPTAPVANINDVPTGLPTISDPTPTEGQQLTASTLSIADADGLTTAVFTFQWQQSALGGGTTFTDIAGATAATFTPLQAQVNRFLHVVTTFTDDHGTTETLASAPTAVVGDLFNGGAAAETFNGTAGDDIAFGGGGNDVLNGNDGNDQLFGQAGNDILNGGNGNDILDGGAGNDTLTGDAGNDAFLYTMSTGTDTFAGGLGFDTLNITGTAGNDTLDVTYNGTALTTVEGGAVTGVEAVTADLLGQAAGGRDALSYNGTTTAVTVNLTTGTASGFASIANIENVTGGSGNDTLTGNANANTLNGGTGDDTFFATIGDGNGDSYNGGGNTTGAGGGDTYDLSHTNAGATVTATSASSADIGTDTLGGIENIVGSQGNDTITLNTGSNVIDGQGGDDALAGGDSADRLSGGSGNDTLLGGAGNDTLQGDAGNDTLQGDAGSDTLLGGLGSDTLNGGAAQDTLTGGLGEADTFVFTSTADTGNTAATRDRITDFEEAGGDKIDVSGIDANTATAANDPFVFLNTVGAAFTAAGQLRYVQVGGLTIVEGNVNTALGADFQIELTGTHTLVAGNFTL
jgi:Ca2+-binding RTX toxin-like protein